MLLRIINKSPQMWCYLAGDVWGHGWGGLGVDVGVLRDKAGVVGGDAAEAVSTPQWRLGQAAVATGWTGWVSLRASRGARGATVGAVHTAAGPRGQGGRGECVGDRRQAGGIESVEAKGKRCGPISTKDEYEKKEESRGVWGRTYDPHSHAKGFKMDSEVL